jgi:hypothetical protein
MALSGCAAKPPPSSTATGVAPSASGAVLKPRGAPWIGPDSFSPSGDHIAYLRSGEPTVVTLADCSVLATVGSELQSRDAEGLSVRLPSDDVLLITHSTSDEHSNQARVEEVRALPHGNLTSRGPSFDWFDTELGHVRLELKQGEGDAALSIHALLRPLQGGERRFDVSRTFGEGLRIALRPLAALRDTLIVSREVGAALPYSQIGSIHLKTGFARQLQLPIGVTGQAVVNGDRLALVQQDDSPAFVYELPSLRRVATAKPEGAKEQTLDTLSLGQPHSCVALSASNDVLALWQNRESLAWFSARTGRLLGKTSEDASLGGLGLRYDCWLTFASDERLVLASGRGSVRVVDTTSGRVVLRHDLLNCRRVDNRDNCDAHSALSPNARFFAADNVKQRDENPSVSARPHGYLIDLETDSTYDLGPLQPQQSDYLPPVFDPSSRYLVRGGQVFSTAPFARICDVP